MPIVKTQDLKPGEDRSDNLQVYNGVEYAVIQLTKGYTTLIDIEDYARINAMNWFANVNPRQVRGARMTMRQIIYIQHEILRTTPWELAEQGKEIDHKDGYTLHNWKDNLRIVTRQENMLNTDRHKKRVGVSFHRPSGLWIAYLSYPYSTRVSLGYWRTEERAKEIEAMARILQPDYPNAADFKEIWKTIKPRKAYDRSAM